MNIFCRFWNWLTSWLRSTPTPAPVPVPVPVPVPAPVPVVDVRDAQIAALRQQVASQLASQIAPETPSTAPTATSTAQIVVPTASAPSTGPTDSVQTQAPVAPAPEPQLEGEIVLDPLKGEQLVRMMVEQAAGYDDPILRFELGGMRNAYVDAYETGAGSMGADIGKLRMAAVYPSWWVLMSGASNPTSIKNVAAVQVLLDQGAIKGGGSLDGFIGASM